MHIEVSKNIVASILGKALFCSQNSLYSLWRGFLEWHICITSLLSNRQLHIHAPFVLLDILAVLCWMQICWLEILSGPPDLPWDQCETMFVMWCSVIFYGSIKESIHCSTLGAWIFTLETLHCTLAARLTDWRMMYEWRWCIGVPNKVLSECVVQIQWL